MNFGTETRIITLWKLYIPTFTVVICKITLLMIYHIIITYIAAL